MLDEMAREKRKEVAARRASMPLATIRAGLEPTDRRFAAALRRGPTTLVLGCKAKSVVRGKLTRDHSPGDLASAYAPFADAIAVWTDGPFYGGSLSHLGEARRVAPQPIACADLVVDPYQVYEARRHGADAMMLTVALLPQSELRACLRAAASLAMECALIVHDQEDLERAVDTDAPVIIVDNRNLRTLEIDRNTCARLASTVPDDRVLLCQGGIRNHRDLLAMRDLVDGFVVATSLVRARRPAHAVRSLAFGRVCIDGLHRSADARAARTAGATHGAVVVRSSDDVVRLGRALAPSSLAVVVDLPEPTPRLVEAVVGSMGPAVIRLPTTMRRDAIPPLVEVVPDGCELWGSYHPHELDPPITADDMGVDRVELDLRAPRRHEPVAPGIARLHPQRSRIVLAGVSAEQAEIADELSPWATRYRLPVGGRAQRIEARTLESLFEHLRGRGRRSGWSA